MRCANEKGDIRNDKRDVRNKTCDVQNETFEMRSWKKKAEMQNYT